MATPTFNTPLAYSPLTVSGTPQANMLIDGLQWANNSGLPATTNSYSFAGIGLKYLDGSLMNEAGLVQLDLMAAELPLNATNIRLSGQLSVQGLPYTPMG